MTQFTGRFPEDARADGIAVTGRAFQFEPQPIFALGRVVLQQYGSSTVGSNEHVDRAVIVVVAHGQPPRSKVFFKCRPALCAYIFQLAVWALMKKQEWLLVPNLPRVTTDHVIRMAVGQDQIERAVVVIVEVLESPAAQKPGSLRNAVRVCDIVKGLVFVVSVKRKHFLIDIRHKEILPAIVVQIAGVDAHTGTRLAVVAKCYLGLQCHFFPAGLSGCIRTAVDEQKILDRIVGNEQVHTPVVVYIRRHHAKRLACRPRYIRAFAHFRERAITVVVVEKTRSPAKNSRNAVIVISELVIAAGEFLLRAIVNKTADEEVKTAIIVEVEPYRAGGPAGRSKAGFLSHVGERAVAIVLVENASSIGCDEDIRPPVVVVVTDGNAHSESSARHPRSFGHIGERAVAIVLVKCIAVRLIGGPEIARPAVHQVNVHPAIIVVVEKSTTGPQSLRKVAIV